MSALRKAHERGHANHGWLDTYHTFSFADYHDRAYMGFSALRVINEDTIAPGEGFGTHPHRDMEILTYVLSGELAHKDSMGNGRTIKAGEVQGMSAGTGITHSEFNASGSEPCHLLQIWILPHTKDVKPAYGEWYPSGEEKQGWALAASGDGANGSILIHQDARMYITVPEEDKTLPLPLQTDRNGWLQVAKGEAELAGHKLVAGDGLSFSASEANELRVKKGSEILLFDLP